MPTEPPSAILCHNFQVHYLPTS